MPFFKDRVLTDTIEIKTTPRKIFSFLTSSVDDDSHRAWHQQDHVSFRWLKGQPWKEGSVIYAEVYIHGKLHKLKFKITKIGVSKSIEYLRVSRFIRKFLPKNAFIIEPREESCLFIVSGAYRVGWIGKTFFNAAIEKGLASAKQHMKEEGGILKAILET